MVKKNRFDDGEMIPLDSEPSVRGKKTKKNDPTRQPSLESMDFDQPDQMAVKKKKGAKNEKKGKALDTSTMSYRSAFDRSSVHTTMSRKRQQTIEEYMSGQFGRQFYELVFKLS